ncbi:hypothetical protein GGS20DRAFT_552411 [Poronia punctata]|nr:hypothetical protein GGS20DRAFT_552411 [Poronia punctata]
MEDLRDAKLTVANFAELIDRLQPESHTGLTPLTRPGASYLACRQNSHSSQKSTSLSSRWRNKKKEWEESVEGILWNELEQPQSEVARTFRVDQTALKEYISSSDMMDLGSEFARHYDYDDTASQKYWAAEDLFFELQTVKQGDMDPAKWTGAKVYKKDWDMADHLTRFVLLAEQYRLCSGQEKWTTWEWNFPLKVAFYLSVLRCYTIRAAKQKQLAKTCVGSTSPRSSYGSKASMNSRHD